MKAKRKKQKEYVEIERVNWLLISKTILYYPIYIFLTIFMCIYLIILSFIPVLGGFVSWSLYNCGDKKYWDTEVEFIKKIQYEVRKR